MACGFLWSFSNFSLSGDGGLATTTATIIVLLFLLIYVSLAGEGDVCERGPLFEFQVCIMLRYGRATVGANKSVRLSIFPFENGGQFFSSRTTYTNNVGWRTGTLLGAECSQVLASVLVTVVEELAGHKPG